MKQHWRGRRGTFAEHSSYERLEPRSGANLLAKTKLRIVWSSSGAAAATGAEIALISATSVRVSSRVKLQSASPFHVRIIGPEFCVCERARKERATIRAHNLAHQLTDHFLVKVVAAWLSSLLVQNNSKESLAWLGLIRAPKYKWLWCNCGSY